MTGMDRKLNAAATGMELLGLVLLVAGAGRADGGLTLWLLPGLAGIGLLTMGLLLSVLCSRRGRAFRRSRFGRKLPPAAAQEPPPVIPFPKAG